MDVLLRCSTSTVQPGELFPLFPEHTRPWAGRKLHARQHWGLRPPLADLETLIDRLDHSENSYGSAHENGNVSVKHRMAAAARQCIADYLLEVGDILDKPCVCHPECSSLAHLLCCLDAPAQQSETQVRSSHASCYIQAVAAIRYCCSTSSQPV